MVRNSMISRMFADPNQALFVPYHLPYLISCDSAYPPLFLASILRAFLKIVNISFCPSIIQIFTYQFSPVAHNFPSLALYPHGAIEDIVLAVPYVNISDISEFYQPHIRYIQVLHQIED